MDFLKYSGEAEETDATVLYARPCAFRTFRDIHVTELLGLNGILRKSHMTTQDGFESILCNLTAYSYRVISVKNIMELLDNKEPSLRVAKCLEFLILLSEIVMNNMIINT
ncbi:MAG: hypothetical protein K2N77_04280 [Lachnospiraceae bacterium]|nr:hypothetical protein [Lachnospiraceae bacterium]